MASMQVEGQEESINDRQPAELKPSKVCLHSVHSLPVPYKVSTDRTVRSRQVWDGPSPNPQQPLRGL